MKPHILLTEGSTRKAFAFVQSLGAAGLDVSVCDTSFFSQGFWSKHCKGRYTVPDPETKPVAFLARVESILETGRFTDLIPVGHYETVLIAKNKERLGRFANIIVADYEKVSLTMDKKQAVEKARKVNTPVPETHAPGSIDEVAGLAGEIKYPALVKPRDSSGGRGIRHVKNSRELLNEYSHVHSFSPLPLIQEYIPSDYSTVCYGALLDRDANIVAHHTYKLYREYPVEMGVSTLSETTMDEELIKHGSRILKEIGWFGLASVEFKIDKRDGIPKFLEINGRPWATLRLAMHAGIDFPHLLYRVGNGEAVEPVKDYRKGIRLRWLLGDMLYFLSSRDRFSMKPSFFDFFDRNTYLDDGSLSDPLAGLAYWLWHVRGAMRMDFWEKYVLRKR